MQQEISNTKGVISLSCGILSIVCVLGFFYTSFFGIIFGILAIVFGHLARKKVKNPMATAGFICGIIGTSLCGVFFAGCLFHALFYNSIFHPHFYYW